MNAVLWTPAYIALGSNLDRPEAQIERAFTELTTIRDTRLILRSSLYRSAPMGPQDQPQFIKCSRRHADAA
jgi:2-amino-4-hydroxy-6-hydroxymethyldihydropteridine diphosphokinase